MNFENEPKGAESLLQFQDFGIANTNSSGNNTKPPPYEQTHNFSKFPESHIDIDEERDAGNASTAPNNQQTSGPSMLSWAYYQRYFDVDTPQVKERVIWSFLPRPSRDTLTTYIRPSPDLYGPFWICVTLVFCIAIMGNIADYMQSGGEGQHWRYDFRKVSISATTIFCYALLVPLLLWVLLWWRRRQDDQTALGLMEMISLYGYSLSIYIPISILWTIPFPWIQWTFVIVGAALSGTVLVLSLWPPLSASQRGIAVALLGVILALHFLLAAGLQLYFFRYSHNVTTSSGNQGVSPAQRLSIEPLAMDKVTELHGLDVKNLVLEEAPNMPGTNAIQSKSSIEKSIQANNASAIQSNNVSPTEAHQMKKTAAVTIVGQTVTHKHTVNVEVKTTPSKSESVTNLVDSTTN